MVEAVVEYDYDAELSDELTLRVGDVITNVQQMTGGWWKGTNGKNTGMFPDNFVKVLTAEPTKNGSSPDDDDDDAGVTLRNKKTTSTVTPKRCRVLFSYQPAHTDELELNVDEVIEVEGEVEDGWWRGTVNNKKGVFPSNFVEGIVEGTEDKKRVARKRVTKNGLEAKEEAVQNENLKNENMKGKASSRISSLIKEVEAKSKVNPALSSSKAKIKNSSTEKLEDERNERRQSPVGEDKKKESLGQTAPKLPPKPVREQCIVIFPYTALNEDELTLVEGQVINILTKEMEDKGWWKGEVGGKVGVFPDNFVKMIAQSEMNSSSDISTTQSKETPEKTAKPSRPSMPQISATAKPSKPSVTGNDLPKKTSASNLTSKTFIPDKLPGYKPEPSKPTVSEPSKRTLPTSNQTSKTFLSNQDREKSPAPEVLKSKSGFLSSVKRHSFGKSTPPPKPKPAAPSKPPSASSSSRLSPAKTGLDRQQSELADFDIVSVSTDKLSHPTAGRVKAPKRRPPSSVVNKDVSTLSFPYTSLPPTTTATSENNTQATPPASSTSNANQSKSLEDLTWDNSNILKKKQRNSSDSIEYKNNQKPYVTPPGYGEANKSRRSFKLIRQVKDVLGGLGHSHVTENNHSSKISEEKPVETEFRSKVSSISSRSSMERSKEVETAPPPPVDVKSEETSSKKPDWLEELSRKQAVRKSGLFKDSPRQISQPELKTTSTIVDVKPQVPAKPTQIKEEAKLISAQKINGENSRGKLEDHNNKENIATTRATRSEGGETLKLASNNFEGNPTDLENMSLLNRVRRLEKLLADTQTKFDEETSSLKIELQMEREKRCELEKEIKLWKAKQ